MNIARRDFLGAIACAFAAAKLPCKLVVIEPKPVFDGFVDSYRMTKGVARYGHASFKLPMADWDLGTSEFTVEAWISASPKSLQQAGWDGPVRNPFLPR